VSCIVDRLKCTYTVELITAYENLSQTFFLTLLHNSSFTFALLVTENQTFSIKNAELANLLIYIYINFTSGSYLMKLIGYLRT
jgi:hypothetical protein